MNRNPVFLVLNDHSWRKIQQNLDNSTTQPPMDATDHNLTIRSSALEYCEIVICGTAKAQGKDVDHVERIGYHVSHRSAIGA